MPYPMYCTFCGCINLLGIIAKVTSISAFEKCKMYLVAGRMAWYQIAGWPAGLHGCVHLMACTHALAHGAQPAAIPACLFYGFICIWFFARLYPIQQHGLL